MTTKCMWTPLLVNLISLVAILGSSGVSTAEVLVVDNTLQSLEAEAPELTEAQASVSKPMSQETLIFPESEALTNWQDIYSSTSTVVVAPEQGSNSLPSNQHSPTGSVVVETPVVAPEQGSDSLPNKQQSPTESVVVETPSPSGQTQTVSQTLFHPDETAAASSTASSDTQVAENSEASFLSPVETPISTKASDLALPNPTISYSAADLRGFLVAEPPSANSTANIETEGVNVADLPPEGEPKPSLAPNLPVLRYLKKPRGNRLLQTEVNPNLGIRDRDTSERFWTRDFLTGNWGGLRDELYDRGYEFTLVHFADFYANVEGGKERGFAYNGVTVAGIDIYTSKTGWWENGQIHVTAASVIRSATPRRTFVGSLNSLYAIEPEVDGLRLTELWYGHKFDNNRIEVRIGQIFPFIKVAQAMSSGIFTNPSFQYPAFLGSTPKLGLNTSFAAPPFGIQVFYNVTPKVTLAAHILDGFNAPGGGRDNVENLSIGLSGEDGIEGIFEVGYKLNQERGATGLPGNYKLGFQFHTGRFEDNSENEDGDSLATSGGSGKTVWGNYSLYAIAEQMLFRESPDPTGRTQGLTAFLKAQFAPPENINVVSLNIAGGLNYEGLIPGRDRDVLALGVSYTQTSDGIRRFDRERSRVTSGLPVRDGGETVIELLYLAEIAPWWVVIGSAQRIINPGGSSDNQDATVLGISSRFAF